jgi:CTP:molybdopterin cytidylyltransferase MocA
MSNTDYPEDRRGAVSRISGIVLAAGGATRFGELKQLSRFRGKPLLEYALASVAGAMLSDVVVVLGAEARRVLSEVDLHGARPVLCDKWRSGMSSSLRAGVEAVGDVEAAVVVLGDQPLLSPRAVVRVIAARDPSAVAVRATYGGILGHPVLLERRALERTSRISGDEGAKQVLTDKEVHHVSCDGLGSPLDVDVPSDLVQLERLTDN